MNGIIQKQGAAKISPDESILDLGIDDEMISGAVVDEDKTEENEHLIGWDDFAHSEDALVLKPVEHENIESSLTRREPFEPPTITVIEPPLQEIVEHSPLIETAARVIPSQQESPAVIARPAPSEMRTKLFLILLIIIAAALALTLFDPATSFRNKAPINSPPEESTKEGSTEAAQPAKPALNEVEDRAPLDGDVGPARPEKSVWNRSNKVRTSRRVQGFKAGYSRQKPIVRAAPRKLKSNTAARSAKRTRVRAR